MALVVLHYRLDGIRIERIPGGLHSPVHTFNTHRPQIPLSGFEPEFQDRESCVIDQLDYKGKKWSYSESNRELQIASLS